MTKTSTLRRAISFAQADWTATAFIARLVQDAVPFFLSMYLFWTHWIQLAWSARAVAVYSVRQLLYLHSCFLTQLQKRFVVNKLVHECMIIKNLIQFMEGALWAQTDRPYALLAVACYYYCCRSTMFWRCNVHCLLCMRCLWFLIITTLSKHFRRVQNIKN